MSKSKRIFESNGEWYVETTMGEVDGPYTSQSEAKEASSNPIPFPTDAELLYTITIKLIRIGGERYVEISGDDMPKIEALGMIESGKHIILEGDIDK